MKFLVLFACAIAATSAGVITPLHYVHHEVPVVNSHGVPQDTVEVQHAKAAHYAAKSEAHVRNGDYIHTSVPVVAASAVPVVSHYNTHVPVVSHVNAQYAPVVHNNNAHYVPVVDSNGVPQDTAEVQHAKAVHHAHKVEAHVRNGDYAYQTYSTPVVAAVSPVVVAQQTWTGEQHVPVINQNGVPEETVEVKQAKAEHFAAVKDAAPVVAVHTVPVVAPVVAAQPAWTGEQHVPIINNGVPEETVEVKQAKADHFAAVKDAEIHNVEEHVVTGYEHNSLVVAQSVWTGEQHVPVINNGVPEETVEVKQAKADHFAAVKDAEVHNVVHHGYVQGTPVVAQAVWTGEQHVPVINQNGVPVETVEVQQAKSNHFAAVRVAESSYVHNTPVVASVVAPVVAQPAWTGEQHVPVINNGVPEDTVEVKQAKADHFAAVKDAEVHNVEEHGHVHNSQVVAQAVWTGEQHVPVINQNGVPVETVEVQQAKANHYAAVKVAGPAYVHSTQLVASVVAPVVAQPVWTGEQHVPVIANGVPEETVEVQQAKADHFAAVKDAEVHHVEENVKDVVTETPDVVAAKGAHFAAHVESRARSAPVDAYYTPYVTPYVNQYYGNYRYSEPYVQYY